MQRNGNKIDFSFLSERLRASGAMDVGNRIWGFLSTYLLSTDALFSFLSERLRSSGAVDAGKGISLNPLALR